MRYLNPLRYIHYHTQLAIPTIYDDSLSFYEIMNKTNLHFNEVINDMNENYEIIDKAFQEVLEQTNKWMEEAKAQADRAEQEANKSQASAEDAKNQADRASSEADAAAASALEAQNQADRASSEADRAHTEAENAKAQAQAAANSAQESATSAAASAGSASESAASATESKKSADASAASATESKNSADASANSASQAAQSATASQNSAEASANSASQSAASATASQNSAVASANSASQAAQSATDAANSAKEAADTLDEAKETFVKKAGDTMSGKLTISYGGLSVDGSADISGDLNTGRLQVGKPDDHRDTHLYGNLYLNDMLTMSIDSNVALKFANLQDGLKLYAPLSFEPSPLRISNVANPQNDFDAVNKQTLDSEVRSINASLTQVNEKITSLTSRMDTAESNIKTNTSNITSLTSRVDKTETDITSLTSRVTTNESNISSINTEISNIKQDITTVEGDYVKKAGDTMTGNLTMGTNQIILDTGHITAGNNTLLFEGYPGVDVDGAKISMVAEPTDLMDAVNKEYVDGQISIAKNDVQEQFQNYLPLTGGTLTGAVRFGTTASIGELVDFGLVAKMDNGNLGIVTQTIIHTNDSSSTDGVTYTLANVDSDIHYTCAGNGVKQMNIGSFETVKVSSSLLVAEDPTQNMQVATKQYVDQHAGGGGEYVPLNNNLICYISEIGNGVYNCDCYLIQRYNIVGTINADEYSFEKTISHNLNDYLNLNNYSRIGDTLETFIYVTTNDSKNIIIITGRLRESSLTIKVSKTTINTTTANVDKYVNVGKVGSMLLRKNR